MLSNHHHVHLACVANDVSQMAIRDSLTLFFEKEARLTTDLTLNIPAAASYSWRCINECDYVIVLIGNSYGELNHSGVSQLHISYLNAKTKNKPMVVLIHSNEGDRHKAELSSQLKDFIGIIERQVSSLWHYDDHTDFSVLFDMVYRDLLRQRRALDEPISEFKELLQSHHIKRVNPSRYNDDITKMGDSLNMEFSFDAETTKRKLMSNIDIDGELLVNCTAHAFRGGSLSEVVFVASLIWRDILTALTMLTPVFSSQSLHRCLNELAAEQALDLVAKIQPDVHAISRCQVSKMDALWAQEQLAITGWITSVDNGGKEGWKISERTKVEFASQI